MSIPARDSPRAAESALPILLAGSWRKSPPDLQISADDVASILPLILASGTVSLAWWRLSHSSLRGATSLCETLQQAYRQQAIRAATHELQVARVFSVLCSAGIDPILIKGWAVSRFYPEWGMRPCGDIDLCVSPDQLAEVSRLLDLPELNECTVDLEHDEITKFGDKDFAQLYDRSQSVELDGIPVRVLGREDSLFVLCVHFLKHGAWRPLWLCDIAAALEARPADFDWDYCLGKNPRRANWILCTLELAHQLLDAELGDVPIGHKRVPEWLRSSVLRQWAKPHFRSLTPFSQQIRVALQQPREFLQYLRRRWPNPIEATVNSGAEFGQGSRLPLQVRYCFSRALKLLPGRIDSKEFGNAL